ncbi:MAG: GC-type dockerin domain-anchored protein, partial [Phycisphaerales bacterium JB041]
TLMGGTLTGGTLSQADGENLRIGANSSNRLVDVTIAGDLVLDVTSGRVRVEGSTSWATARLVGNSTAIGFTPGATLQGDIVFEGGSGNRAVTTTAAGTLTIPAGRAVYADPAFTGTAQVGGSFHFNGAMDLVNEGTIEVRSSTNVINSLVPATLLNTGLIMSHTSTLRIAGELDNHGVIAADTGRLHLDGSWSNASGTVQLTDADLELDGAFTTADVGTITRAGSTEVNVTGDIDNSGDTLAFDASTGSWILSGGSVTGGTLSHSDGERLAIGLNSNNHLTDVSVVGGLMLDIGGGRVQIRGTTAWDVALLSAGSVALGFDADASVPGDVVLSGSGVNLALVSRNDGGLTIPGGVTVSTDPAFSGTLQIGGAFYWSGRMDLVVEGELRLGSLNSGNLHVEPDTLQNSGVIASTGNTVTLEPVTLVNTGVLRAQDGGTLLVDLDGAAWTNDGTLAAGPGSVVEVAGDLVLAGTSVVRIEINGFTSADIGFLRVDGGLTLGGTLSVVGVDGWEAECVSLDCVHADSLAGGFATLDLPQAPEGHKSFVIFVPDGETIRFAISPESDWNSDGQLDTLDFLAFLNDWVAGESNADFNNDGRIDTLDFLAFLNSWTAGC